MNYEIREKCAVCGSESFEILSSIDYPVFCGTTTDSIDKDLIANEEIVISSEGILQLRKLIPLEILYADEHGSGAVGGIWDLHHREFSKFIAKFNPKKVLEIGGGHGKIARFCVDVLGVDWTIIEPNVRDRQEGVKYIDSFFKKEFLEESYDTIVHSHTFEHIYNPNEFLRDIQYANNKWGGGGKNIF